jgi:competence protein ComEC
MNSYIERLNGVSFATLNDLSLSTMQMILLYLSLFLLIAFLFYRKVTTLYSLLCSLFLILALRSFALWEARGQALLIVYGFPSQRAVDLVDGTSCTFFAPPEVVVDPQVYHFHLRPARLAFRVSDVRLNTHNPVLLRYRGHQVVLASDSVPALPYTTIHVLVVSGRKKVLLNRYLSSYAVQQVVIDGSVPRWKREQWKKDCAALSIPCHDVRDKGAFVMNLRAPTFAQPSPARELSPE